MTETPAPRAAILYLRLSDDRNETGSFPERERRLREKAAHLGWAVDHVVIENDAIGSRSRSASAFKRRKITLPNGEVALRVVRPGFRSILDDLAAGRADALLAEDLDRAMRDPRDLEDLIDVMEQHRLSADSLSGSLKFTDGGTDSEITTARMMVTVANKSSRDTSRRVKAAKAARASAGKFLGGQRPYGFAPDGLTVVADEAEVIREAANAVLAGLSMRSIARDLRERGVPTVGGARWQPETLKSILLRRRNIGRLTYHGEDAGPAPWAAILTEDVARAVRIKLTGTAKSTPGPAPRWLLSGIARCACGQPLKAARRAGRAPVYRCKLGAGGGHTSRDAVALDAYVTALVCERLSRPDAVDLLAPSRPDVDTRAMREQAAVLRARLDDLGAAFAEGEIDRRQLAAGSDRLKAKLSAIEAELASATTVSPLSAVVGAEDVRATWEALSLGQRRAIVGLLLEITVLPAGRGRGFDPDFVGRTWIL